MSGPFPGIAARRKDVGFLSEPASSLTRRSWDYDDVRPFARQLSCTRGPGAGDQSLQPHSRFESEGWRFSSEELTLPDGEWRDAYSSVTIVPHRGEAAISETEGRDLRWPGNCFAYRRTWITEAVRAKSQEAEECTGQDRYPGMATELREAMRELDDAEEDAREDGFPIPSTVAIRNSRRILRELYEFSPQYFAVYPEPDGGIAIHAQKARGSSVILILESDGGALCLVHTKGKSRRARYGETGRLPDAFVLEALEELDWTVRRDS